MLDQQTPEALIAPPKKLERLLPLPKVMEACGLSCATIYRRMAAGTFPRPKSLGRGCVRWRESDIIDWQESLD